MVQYKEKILNAMVDSYENSLLFQGQNKVKQHIFYRFTKKTIPQYFDESSLEYENIHACVKELEGKGFLEIGWKKGKENHIIEKLTLEEENMGEIYQFLNRTPKSELIKKNLCLLEQKKEKCTGPIAGKFAEYLEKRIREGESVKEFVDLSQIKRTEQILDGLAAIECNCEECYIREFSIRQFGDSKVFEQILGVIGKIMKRFEPGYEDMEIEGILAEYRIFHTPNYVYVKGQGVVSLPANGWKELDLSGLRQGIGLSGEDLQFVDIMGKTSVKKVITVENLTTFFRWTEEDSLIVYLGGYHNKARRRLLKMLYRQMPDAQYLHFGDIDVGGYEIYRDLCEKTGIPFKAYYMGVEELEAYKSFGKKLTENDRKRLDNLIQKAEEKEWEYLSVLKYMKEKDYKLEQECIQKKF